VSLRLRWVLAAIVGAALIGALVWAYSGDESFTRATAESQLQQFHDERRPNTPAEGVHCDTAGDAWRCRFREDGKECAGAVSGKPSSPQVTYFCG
jgi:hypothetical protein